MRDGPVAQWTEHRSSEPGVAGSSPAGPASLEGVKNLHAQLHPGPSGSSTLRVGLDRNTMTEQA